MTLDELRAGAGTRFLFHYTDSIRADAVIEERIFVSVRAPSMAWGSTPPTSRAPDRTPSSCPTRFTIEYAEREPSSPRQRHPERLDGQSTRFIDRNRVVGLEP